MNPEAKEVGTNEQSDVFLLGSIITWSLTNWNYITKSYD